MPEHLRMSAWLERLFGGFWRQARLASQARADARPYGDVIDRIQGFRTLDAGWNSYRAGRIEKDARARAIRFVGSLPNLGRRVPPPVVAPTSNGGVALHWDAGDREVDIIFLSRGGEYSVALRKSDEVLAEGPLDRVDLLKDVIGRYVVQR